MIPICSDCLIRPAVLPLWLQDRIALCMDCLGERVRGDVAGAFRNPLAMPADRLEHLIGAHGDVVSLEYRNGIPTWRWTPEWPGVAA